MVNFSKPGMTKQVRHYVHQIVAKVFIGPKPKGLEVMHKDETKDNNRVTNLKYGTHSENLQAAARHRRKH